MNLSQRDIQQFVEENIAEFHNNRLNAIMKMKLSNVLARKNPYLFRAKNIGTADELVRQLLQAYLSSQEETIFGEFLEKLAIFACKTVKGGIKSGIPNIDLEFEEEGIRYILTIKSGSNWGNSSQIRKMVLDFITAKKAIRTQNQKQQIVAVNGCCYGKDKQPDKGQYFKLCGQAFWEFITGNSDFYVTIIEPIGHNAKAKNAQFYQEYDKLVNRMTLEFLRDYCHADGSINWPLLVAFNSGKALTNLIK